MPALIYYEDMLPQAKIVGPSVVVDQTEMVEFAKIWDPVPIHIAHATYREQRRATRGFLGAPTCSVEWAGLHIGFVG